VEGVEAHGGGGGGFCGRMSVHVSGGRFCGRMSASSRNSRKSVQSNQHLNHTQAQEYIHQHTAMKSGVQPFFS
jgi:hypothetical protein